MTDTQQLYAGAAAVFAGLAIASVLLLRSPSRTSGVSRSLAVIEQLHPRTATTPSDLPPSDRLLRPGLARLATIARRISPTGTPGRLQRRLDLAGNPRTWTVERVLAMKAIAFVLGAVPGVLVATASPPLLGVPFLLATSVGGFFVPDVLLYNAGLKRQLVLRRSVPDALDMLTVCVEAGLGFDAGLAQVAGKVDGPIAGEFARLLREMQIGKSRVTAFQDLASRTTVPELRIFVSALVQSDRLGIPLAGVLREQSAEMRLKRRQRAEEQAQKVPVKILFPLIFCILPALFVVVIGPGAIQIANSLMGV